MLAELNDLPDARRSEPPSPSRRLRAIGHLPEAEDVAQEWPDLHASIREARKPYLADRATPDWTALEGTTSKIRQAGWRFLRPVPRLNGHARQAVDKLGALPSRLAAVQAWLRQALPGEVDIEPACPIIRPIICCVFKVRRRGRRLGERRKGNDDQAEEQ